MRLSPIILALLVFPERALGSATAPPPPAGSADLLIDDFCREVINTQRDVLEAALADAETATKNFVGTLNDEAEVQCLLFETIDRLSEMLGGAKDLVRGACDEVSTESALRVLDDLFSTRTTSIFASVTCFINARAMVHDALMRAQENIATQIAGSSDSIATQVARETIELLDASITAFSDPSYDWAARERFQSLQNGLEETVVQMRIRVQEAMDEAVNAWRAGAESRLQTQQAYALQRDEQNLEYAREVFDGVIVEERALFLASIHRATSQASTDSALFEFREAITQAFEIFQCYIQSVPSSVHSLGGVVTGVEISAANAIDVALAEHNCETNLLLAIEQQRAAMRSLIPAIPGVYENLRRAALSANPEAEIEAVFNALRPEINSTITDPARANVLLSVSECPAGFKEHAEERAETLVGHATEILTSLVAEIRLEPLFAAREIEARAIRDPTTAETVEDADRIREETISRIGQHADAAAIVDNLRSQRPAHLVSEGSAEECKNRLTKTIAHHKREIMRDFKQAALAKARLRPGQIPQAINSAKTIVSRTHLGPAAAAIRDVYTGCARGEIAQAEAEISNLPALMDAEISSLESEIAAQIAQEQRPSSSLVSGRI